MNVLKVAIDSILWTKTFKKLDFFEKSMVWEQSRNPKQSIDRKEDNYGVSLLDGCMASFVHCVTYSPIA